MCIFFRKNGWLCAPWWPKIKFVRGANLSHVSYVSFESCRGYSIGFRGGVVFGPPLQSREPEQGTVTNSTLQKNLLKNDMPRGSESGPSEGPVFEPLTVFHAERFCKTTTASSGLLQYFFQKSKSKKQVSKQTHIRPTKRRAEGDTKKPQTSLKYEFLIEFNIISTILIRLWWK